MFNVNIAIFGPDSDRPVACDRVSCPVELKDVIYGQSCLETLRSHLLWAFHEHVYVKFTNAVHAMNPVSLAAFLWLAARLPGVNCHEGLLVDLWGHLYHMTCACCSAPGPASIAHSWVVKHQKVVVVPSSCVKTYVCGSALVMIVLHSHEKNTFVDSFKRCTCFFSKSLGPQRAIVTKSTGVAFYADWIPHFH